MKKDETYSFNISVDENGNQIPCMNFYTTELMFMNNLVVDFEMMNSNDISELIKNIEDVIYEKKEEFTIDSQEAAFISVKKNFSTLEDLLDFDEEGKIIEVKTLDLLNLFTEWNLFLKKYENNEIPNLKYNLMK